MGKADPPTPPNPAATAAAQTGTNVSTAVANAYLQNVNQNTPQGSLSYAPTGNYSWTDPSTGQTYQIPTFTSTQTYTPQGQQTLDQQNQTKLNLATMGNQQSQRVGGLLSQPFNPNMGAPTAGNAQNILNVPQAATSYDPGGDITRSYGPSDNFSADRQRVEDSLMARMNPQLAIEKQGIQQQLADQGIRPGSQAYSDAMMTYSRQANDARYGAIAQGGQEQTNLNQMAAQQAAFQNAAQGQQYQQNAGLGTFYNAGLAQQLAQQQSGFNAQNSALNQYLQQQYQQRNQPLNEISALLSGSQVQQPNWLNSPTSQIPTTDFAGITNQGFQNQMGIYNSQQGAWNSLMGGILGGASKLGSAALMSDRREKENIEQIGTVLAAKDDQPKMGTVFAADDKAELPIYQYSYKDDPASTRHVGPMAQDVEQVTPKAVIERKGVKYIKPQHVMGSILRAA